MPPRERSCDGRVSIQLNAESGQAVIEKVVTQMHVLAPPVAKRCKLIQDLKLVHGSRAELPLRYGVVKGWEAFVHSDFQEPAAPSLDELAEWLRVRAESRQYGMVPLLSCMRCSQKRAVGGQHVRQSACVGGVVLQ